MRTKNRLGKIMFNVIIGAGPAGLYAAIQFHRAGLRNIIIYDPRAGVYTRPGHISAQTFYEATKAISNTFKTNSSIFELLSQTRPIKTYHIKDLERTLYKTVQQLGIRIEKKSFLRLHQDNNAPGVIVLNNESGLEETVPADYVFDCTGSKRMVVSSVNCIVPSSPFKFIDLVDLPIKHHFIAYVKMEKMDMERFSNAYLFPKPTNTTSYVNAILKLRALGWMELVYPRCYGAPFGKDKICLYMHAPVNLQEKDYHQWIQTVLECYTTPIRFESLAPSRKYPSKPRFNAFTINAQALQTMSYKNAQLPTIVALGDAQIDFDYALAHGILDGIKRTDSLLKSIEILNGKIVYFDSSDYSAEIDKQLRNHKIAIINAAKTLKQSFNQAIESAQLQLNKVIKTSLNQEVKQQLSQIINELDARQCYIKSMQKLAEINAQTIPLKMNTLLMLHHDLFKALELPLFFEKEIEATRNALKQLAVHWKESGTAHYKKKEYTDAAKAYKNALEIYHLSFFQDQFNVEMIQLYSNLSITNNMTKCFTEAMAAAKIALDLIHKNPEKTVAALQEKIIFNYIKALCAQGHERLVNALNETAIRLHIEAKTLFDTYEGMLTNKDTCKQLVTLIDDLEQRIAETIIILPIIADETPQNRELTVPTTQLHAPPMDSGALKNVSFFSIAPPKIQEDKTDVYKCSSFVVS